MNEKQKTVRSCIFLVRQKIHYSLRTDSVRSNSQSFTNASPSRVFSQSIYKMSRPRENIFVSLNNDF